MKLITYSLGRISPSGVEVFATYMPVIFSDTSFRQFVLHDQGRGFDGCIIFDKDKKVVEWIANNFSKDGQKIYENAIRELVLDKHEVWMEWYHLQIDNEIITVDPDNPFPEEDNIES